MAINGVDNDVIIVDSSQQTEQSQKVQQEEKINSTFTASNENETVLSVENQNTVFPAKTSDGEVSTNIEDKSIYGKLGLELSDFANSFSRSSSNAYIKEYESMEKEMAEALSSNKSLKLGKAARRRIHTENVSKNILNFDKETKDGVLNYYLRLTNDYDNSSESNAFDFEAADKVAQKSDDTANTDDEDTRTSDNNLALQGNISYKNTKINANGTVVLSNQRLNLNGSILCNPSDKVQVMGNFDINVKGVSICGTEKFGASYTNADKKFGTGIVGTFEHVLTNTDDGKKFFANADVQGYINAGKNFSLTTKYNAVFDSNTCYQTVDFGLNARGERTFKTKNDGDLTMYGSLSASAEYSKIENYNGAGGNASAEGGLQYTKNDFGAHVHVQGNYNGSYIITDNIGYDGDYDVSVATNIQKKGAFVGAGFSLSSSAEFDTYNFSVDLGYITAKGYNFSLRYAKGVSYNKLDKTASSNSDSNLLSMNVGLPLDNIVETLSSKK